MDSPGAQNSSGWASKVSQWRLCQRASDLLERGRAREALALVKEALALDPTEARAHCLRSWALQELGDYNGSLEAAALAIHLEPEGEWGHRLRAYAYLETGQNRKALEAAQEAARLEPDSLAVLDCVSLCARDCGEMELAREWAERALAQHPEDPRAHELSGTHAMHVREWHEAEAHLRRALALDPCRWSSLTNLGDVRAAQGFPREAIALHYQAVQQAPWRQGIRNALHWALFKYLWRPRLLALVVAALLVWLFLRYTHLAPGAAWGWAVLLYLAGDFLVVSAWLRSLPVPVEGVSGAHRSLAELLFAAAPRSGQEVKRWLVGIGLIATPVALWLAHSALQYGRPGLAAALVLPSLLTLAVWLGDRRRQRKLSDAPSGEAVVPEVVQEHAPGAPQVSGEVLDAWSSPALEAFASEELTPLIEPEPEAPAPDPEEAPRRELKRRAQVMLDLRRPREVLALLQGEAVARPDDEEIWCLVAEAFAALGMHKPCLRAAELALKANPFHTGGHLWKCRSLLARHMAHDALEAARKALELTHYDVEIRRPLVRALLACGELEEAKAELGHLTAQFPEDPEVVCLRGELARKSHDTYRAEMEFRQALTLDRDCAAAWAGLGELRRDDELRQDAAHCFYEAARCNPLEPEYRRRMISAIDAEVDRRQDHATTAFYAVMLLSALIGGVIFLPSLLVFAPLTVLGARSIRASTLRSIFYPMPREVRKYYDLMKPVQSREDAANVRWSCGCLLVLAGIVTGLVHVARHGLWVPALRLLLVFALMYPVLSGRFSWGRKTSGAETVSFQFPEDVPEGRRPVTNSGEVATPHEVAWAQLRSAEPGRAQQTARQILARDSADLEAIRVLSLASLAVGDRVEGVNTARAALAGNPEDLPIRALVAVQLAAQADTGVARRHLQATEDEAGALAAAVAEYGTALYQAGATAAAEAAAALAHELDAASAAAWGLTGDLAAIARRWPEAEAAYRRAAALDPTSGLYVSNLGAVALSRRRFLEARRLFNQALALSPDCRPAVGNLEYLLHWINVAMALFLSILIGVAAARPTFAGQLRNNWMLWATLLGPVGVGLAAIVVRQLGLAWVTPALRRSPLAYGGAACPWTALVASLVVLLILQAGQSWVEIVLHPALWRVRWQGAATVSFLALYLNGLLICHWYQSRARTSRGA